VTPEAIRDLAYTTDGEHIHRFVILREIAAQLAEQNALARESLEMRKADDASMKAYREDSLGTARAMKDVLTATAPPTLVPVFRQVNPSDQPEHLGCFVLLPDGSYAMAINGVNGPGMVPLEPEEAQRLIALLQKPAEGKPQ
jgi:hypothetical protein